MNSGVLLDLTQIPSQMAGLLSITQAIAFSMLAVIIPYCAVEMNIKAMGTKQPPSYGGLLVRSIVTLACLIGYSDLYSLLLGGSQALAFSVLSEEQWGNFLTQNFHGLAIGLPTINIVMHPINSIQEIILFITSLLVLTARDVIIMLQACFLSLLYAFGPIAIVCAISEKTAGVTRGWVVNSFQIALWSFFLRLVVAVWLTLNPAAGNTGTGNANDFLAILTVNVSFFVMALGTPILTARLVSGESLAILGEAAFGAVQTVLAAKYLTAGGAMLSREIEKYKRAPASEQASFFHHPLPNTATAAYRALFGGPKPEAKNQEPTAKT